MKNATSPQGSIEKASPAFHAQRSAMVDVSESVTLQVPDSSDLDDGTEQGTTFRVIFSKALSENSREQYSKNFFLPLIKISSILLSIIEESQKSNPKILVR